LIGPAQGVILAFCRTPENQRVRSCAMRRARCHSAILLLTVIPLTAIVALLAAAPAQSAERLSITISAGKHDRKNVPTRTPIVLPNELADTTTASVLTDDGRVLAGQLTVPGLLADYPDPPEGKVVRELHFLLPGLAAGKSAEVEVGIPGKAGDRLPQFTWTKPDGKSCDLTHSGKPVLRYMHEPLDESSPERRGETYKPYHHVFDPTGSRLLTKGPGGLFPHHRGLFYGFNRITYGDGKKADTWHCNNGEYQSHDEFQRAEAGHVLGRHLVAISWHGQDGEVFAREEREMTVYRAGDGWLIDFASRLTSAGGTVRLDGDPQHAGFQFRASQEVPDSTKDQTYYIRPDGRDKPGNYRNWPDDKRQVNLPWHAMSIVLGGQRYTISYLDHPDNPKEARYSERDYGRFGSYFEYDLEEDKPLEVQYRVGVQEGEITVEEVEALSDDFVDPPGVEVP
jgi:hypothetical protein